MVEKNQTESLVNDDNLLFGSNCISDWRFVFI